MITLKRQLCVLQTEITRSHCAGLCNLDFSQCISISVTPSYSACLPGYSEAINSSKCMICEKHNYGLLIRAFVLSMAFVTYLIATNENEDIQTSPPTPSPTNTSALKSAFKKVKKLFDDEYFMLLSKTLVLKVLVFYQQQLRYILWPSSLEEFTPYVQTIAALFNFEATIPGKSSDEPICFYEGLTSKEKILTGLIPPIFSAVILFFTFIFGRMLKCQIECQICDSSKSTSCLNTNFGKAFLGLFVLCAGQLFNVAFKILNCQRIGSRHFHFYFGEEECHWSSPTNLIAMSFVISILLSFGIMFIELRKQTKEHREDPDYSLNALCKYYRPQCYYWEFVILLRRITIALYAIFWTSSWFPIVLISFLLFYLYALYKFEPFKTKEANGAEFILMSCIIVVIFIQSSLYRTDSIRYAASVVLALFIIIPIFAVFVYSMIMLHRIRKHPDQFDFSKRASIVASSSSPKSMALNMKNLRRHNQNAVSGYGGLNAAAIALAKKSEVEMQCAASVNLQIAQSVSSTFSTSSDDDDSDKSHHV